MKRGGQPNLEISHARQLLDFGAEDIWGWNTPAGQERVKGRVSWLTEVCGLGQGVRVLECGCGTGIFTRELAKTGANITAVDISADLLNEARKHCAAENVNFVQANLEDPQELPDLFFDVLSGVSVLHHLVLPKSLVALKKKLRHGARFAFSEPNLLNPINKYFIFTPDLEKRRRRGVSPAEMAFYPKELQEIFVEAGFEVHQLEHRDFMHPSIPERLINPFKVIQFIAEHTPLLRRWSGSLWISGIRP